MKVYQSVIGRLLVVILMWVVVSSVATVGTIGPVSAFAASLFTLIGGGFWIFAGTATSTASTLPDYDDIDMDTFDHEEADAQTEPVESGYGHGI